MSAGRPAPPRPADAPTTVKWHDEQTQRVPLTLEAAQLATDEEVALALAPAIWAARDALAGRVAHWMAGHVLAAVVDTPRWRVGIRRMVAKSLLTQSQFVMRPASASTPPEGFRVQSIDDLLWWWAQHGADSPAALPEAYLSAPVELRVMPVLGPGLLAPRHMTLMRLLGQEALDFAALRVRLSANADDLRRDFTALYLTRALVLRGVKPVIVPD